MRRVLSQEEYGGFTKQPAASAGKSARLQYLLA